MKPVSLKLSGLQSYRETQEIDFTSLCDTGLFGIFGPTGSGKSTLLDAITLAMYGKVGRATNGTQGIMNHSEDSLFVAFTFELVSAQGPERYRVERRFKRQGEQSVSNTISRFIEISPEGEKVLADKLAEVTRQVEEKIGLKMDDFTRAVVLPQGKFAEFLSLKGVDRRQMLQRLFHLEKYGDLLGQKLARKVKGTEQTIKELAAEQQGLGSASEEALREAEAALKAVAELAEARRRELGAAQQRAESLAKVRELSEERTRRAAFLEALRGQDVAIRELEARLAKAAAAAGIRPVLTAWKAARQLAAEREAAAVRAGEAAAYAAAAAAQAAAEAGAAGEALSREEPALLLRLDQLEQARALQRECDELAAGLRELRASLEQGTRQRRNLTEELLKEEQLLAKAKQRQQELDRLLTESEVKPSERQRVQLAVNRRQEILRLREEADKAGVEESSLKAKAEQAAGRMGEIGAREQSAEAKCRELTASVLEQLFHLNVLQEEIPGFENALLSREAELRAMIKDKETQLWSLTLAERLQDGQPCPVCGSLHHPGAASLHEEGAGSESELEELPTLLASVRELKYSVPRYADGCRDLLDMLGTKDGEEFAGRQSAQLETAAAGDAKAEVDISSVKSSDDLETFRHHTAKLEEQAAMYRQELERLQRHAREAKASLSALTPELAAVRAEAASVASLLELAAERNRDCRLALSAKQAEWTAEYPDLNLDEVERLQLHIDEKDRHGEDIKQRLKVSIPFIEEKSASISTLTQKAVELDKLLLQWEVQEQGKDSLLREKHERLAAWIGEGAVEELLPETERRLQALRQTAEDSRKKLAECEASNREAAQGDALARQALQSAREQEQEYLVRWEEGLVSSPFNTEAEVVESFMDPEQSEHDARTVKDHRDQEREHEINLKELDAKLGGNMVTEAEWETCRQALELAKAQDEAALQGKARAERDLEDLEARHVRWKELETERLKLEHQSGLLGKLQSSLRGNAFVEYVAEEQLMNVSHAASQRLRSLTKQRYALETDSGGGFVICDDANGGVKRPVFTLSGGETFLTSLALALALSAQIQLRGQYPLQFFFLDEGFGTLDPELLDTVITSLEHLHHDHLAVGIITHVAELRERLARKLIVIPAENGGEGSKVMLERM
ncbi:exonuclease SbcC [Fontibacillus phaseoli]|uniref:Nuclease SbcCD subunit C n=1 Tax=Fontibacillus phaseoli TaxID=1416533 RepID=A0A369BMI6_9BACL|nr:AAA family ATPase [Fontibacillus phaseoli]RCX22763.1 exonuclease SbcC [Fontibacillus phaseoli]